MPTLSTDGPIWTLDLGDDENRFTPSFLDEMSEVLGRIAESNEPAALLTTASGKFYSNGLDLEWLSAHPEQLGAYVERIHALLTEVLTLPVPTAAAINGHAFGAGAMLAMAHDHRVMRQDRGYFCFPEADINIPFTPGMSALIMSKLTPRAAIDAMTTAHRFGGTEARDAGLVDGAAPLDDLTRTAADRIRPHAGKDRGTLGRIKQTMFSDVVDALLQPQG